MSNFNNLRGFALAIALGILSIGGPLATSAVAGETGDTVQNVGGEIIARNDRDFRHDRDWWQHRYDRRFDNQFRFYDDRYWWREDGTWWYWHETRHCWAHAPRYHRWLRRWVRRHWPRPWVYEWRYCD